MEVAEQLETLKFDNGRAPGSPSAAGPQPGQEEPAGGEEPGQEEPAGPQPGQEEPAGGEEPGQASAPAAGGAPGAQGPREEQPGEGSADSDSDTDSDSSSSVSSSSCSLSIGSVESDSQQNGNNTSYHVKPKDELPLEQGPPPVEDLTIILPEDVELKPFGTVSSIIEQLGPSSYVAYCSSGTRSLAQCIFMDDSERKRFHDDVMVGALERVGQPVQYQKKRDERLEQRHVDRRQERLRLAAQVEDRVSATEQALAKLFLEQEWHLREEDRAQQKTVSATPVHNDCKSTSSCCLPHAMA